MDLRAISDPIDWLVEVYAQEGGRLYGGEQVTQLEHAMQCAQLAEQGGHPPTLIVAALLHDLGHMIHKHGRDAAARNIDDRHEAIGGSALALWFPEAVTEPIRLHVDAKRYLCAVDGGYHAALSPSSQHSLELQAGAFTPVDANAFYRQPFAEEAVALRRWDDLAKTPGLPTPGFTYYAPYLRDVCTGPARVRLGSCRQP